MKKQRTHYTSEGSVAILRRRLLEQVPISELCDRQSIWLTPHQFAGHLLAVAASTAVKRTSAILSRRYTRDPTDLATSTNFLSPFSSSAVALCILQPHHDAPGFQDQCRPFSSTFRMEKEMGRLREKLARDKIKLDPDAGLHTLRHRFLTEAGEHTDAFTLQYIAGHDTIKTTMRYVHPRAESVGRAFGRSNQKKKPAEPA
jgi:integrase